MSVLHAAPLATRVTDAVHSRSTKVVLGGVVVAWVALTVAWPGGVGAAAGHANHGGAMPAIVEPTSLAWLTSWLMMVIAMMWPLAVPAVGAVSRSSFRGWRTRLGMVCLATVTVLWLAAGFAGALLARLLDVSTGSLWWRLSFVCAALVLFRSTRRARLLERCLRLPPLAPGGRRGVITAARAGLFTWRRCALLCGPMMLAMTVGHSIILMICASLSAWWEFWHPRAWRDRVPVAFVAAGGLWLLVSEAFSRGVGRG